MFGHASNKHFTPFLTAEEQCQFWAGGLWSHCEPGLPSHEIRRISFLPRRCFHHRNIREYAPPPIINFNAALRASTAWLWYLDHFYFYSMLIVCAILNFPWGWKSVCAGHTVKELCMIGQCQVSRSKISSSPRDGNIRIAWLKCPNDMPDLASTKYSSSLNYMINYIFAKLFLTLTADEEIQNFG